MKPNRLLSEKASNGGNGGGRGFVLVITLTLMILLTVIAVGMLTLASIELRATNHSKAISIAQQNARMALMLAIGDLQKHAGHDQRITATADIAGTAAGEPVAAGAAPLNDLTIREVSKGLSAVQSGTRYWTGVFANQDKPTSIYTQTPSPILVHWLVSGNTSNYPTTGPSILPSDDTYGVGTNGQPKQIKRAVVLAGKNTVGSGSDSANRYVSAPLVEVLDAQKQMVGRYAWWIGDEGVKAKINIQQTFEDADNYAALAAQRRGWETVDGFADYPVPGGSGAHQALPKVVTLGETALLLPAVRAVGPDGSALQKVFHSATTESRGVISDTLHGGTKIDLTAVLAKTLPSSPVVPTIPNYPVKGANIIPAAAAASIKAPKWDALKEFSDRGQDLNGGSILVKAATSDLTAAVAPLVSDIRIMMGAKIITKAANSFNIHACGKFAVTLANPYSRPLKWDRDLEIEIRNLTPTSRPSRIWNASSDRTVFIPQTPSESAVFNQAVFRIRPASLAAGEARAYTMVGALKRPEGGATSRLVVDLDTVDPGSLRNFNHCIELENSHVFGSIPGLDVRENWQTALIGVEMRLSGSSNILRLIEGFELDNGYFGPNTRRFNNEQAAQITQPFPLMLYSFQISQPGQDYLSLMPGGYEWGQRSSTLRTFTDFNLQATRVRKAIASYNPPPFFAESNDSVSQLPPANPPSPGEVGGDTGPGFSRNLAVTPLRWGRSSSGSEKTILFSVPEQISSIAQLQHADLTGDDTHGSLAHQPGNAVGNSYATLFVKRDLLSQSRVDYRLTSSGPATINTTRNYYDICYLLNVSLWDSYFFSTIPRSGSAQPENPSLIHFKANAQSPGLRDAVDAASLLLVDGAFNFNSTDPNAWKAFLASAKHFKHAADGGANPDAAFPRTLEQISASASPPTGNDADSFSGYRRLTDAQLDALAHEIVRQVRIRGPFVSLSHFVNRALVGITKQPALSRCGALQSAIDESGANINFAGNKNAFKTINVARDRVTLVEKNGAPRADYDGGDLDGRPADAFPSTPDWAVTSIDNNFGAMSSIVADRVTMQSAQYKPEQGYRSTGIPGWLTQADVLQVIGPALSARSDTFRIRTFGEALDSNGVSIARVYCEAVVQRIPAYLDPANPATARGNDLTPLNKTYGRQFQIVAFRWLSPNEI